MELEGLRGIAAVVVVLHHFLCAFFPVLIFGMAYTQHSRLEDNIHGTPLGIFYAGTYAVAVFFVLSGFVLSIGYFSTKREDIVKKLAAKRYVRLMIPALVSIVFAYILLRLGVGSMTKEAGEIAGSSWLSGAWNFDTGALDAIYSGTIGIFMGTGTQFNNVLWTMKTEFIGSFMVFGFLLLLAKSSYRWLGYILMMALTFDSWYLSFVLGMVLADAYSLGWFAKLKKMPMLAPVMIIVSLFLGAYPMATKGTIYDNFAVHLASFEIDARMMMLTLGATTLLIGVLVSARVSAWLKKPRVSVLGKYTFSLYLTHLAVLYTFTTAVFLALQGSIGYNYAFLVAFAASVPVVWMVTWGFERYVDEPSIVISKQLADIYEGREPIPRFWIKIAEDYRYAKDDWQRRSAAWLGGVRSRPGEES